MHLLDKKINLEYLSLDFISVSIHAVECKPIQVWVYNNKNIKQFKNNKTTSQNTEQVSQTLLHKL